MTTKELIERAKTLSGKATPGPWYAHATDDDMGMNGRYVGTKECEFKHDNEYGLSTNYPNNDIVAITLLQSPPMALDVYADDNTKFIAESREMLPEMAEKLESMPEMLQIVGDWYRDEMDNHDLDIKFYEWCEYSIQNGTFNFRGVWK